MQDMGNNVKLIGFVQLHVGSKVFALPVQAVKFERDRSSIVPGGFFRDEAGEYGILVDEEASSETVQEQIAAASADAIRHISRKFLS